MYAPLQIFPLLSLFVALYGALVSTSCSAKSANPAPSPDASAVQTAPAEKIDPRVREIVAKLGQNERTGRKDLSRFSTPLIHVNDDGEIQVYLGVKSWEDSFSESLRQLGARIEIANAPLRLVQAWLPYDQVRKVAELPFVLRIVPPSYGVKR